MIVDIRKVNMLICLQESAWVNMILFFDRTNKVEAMKLPAARK